MTSKSASRKKSSPPQPVDVTIGVVGLGLMGRSITTCLLAAGHPVAGITRTASKVTGMKRQALSLLKEMRKEGLLRKDPARLIRRLTVSTDYEDLKGAGLVVETTLENLEVKKEVFQKIEKVVSRSTIIGSNTSAIPVSLLQQGMQHPERFLAIHWAEPAHTTRFMEIACGEKTRPVYGKRAMELARGWGKEPSLLRRDIRGFITNRCMYALFREAFNLVENGYCTIEDVDRSLRNDVGYYMTFAGPFRCMDLTGIPAYAAVMKDLWPELSCKKEVPEMMKKLVASGAQGTANAKGFYRYTPEQAKRWEKLFLKFSYEIRNLAEKYPEDIGDRMPGKTKAGKRGRGRR